MIVSGRHLSRAWLAVDWRTLVHSFASSPRTGATTTAMSGWMFTAVAKAATIVAAAVVEIEWIDNQRAEWKLPDSPMDFSPSGILMAARTGRPPADEDPT